MRIIKAFILLTLFVFLSNNIFAQKNSKNLMPYRVGFKYGFVDQNHNIVIPVKYTSVVPFYNGRALVSTERGTGMIDEKGKIIIPISKGTIDWKGNPYSRDHPRSRLSSNYIFYQNRSSRKFTVYDLNGKKIFKEVYNRIYAGADGHFIVRKLDGSLGMIDENENIIIPFHQDVLIQYNEGDYYRKGEEHYTQYFTKTKTGNFYDKEGKLIKDMNAKCSGPTAVYSSIKFEKPERFKDKPIWFPGLQRNGYRIFQMTQRGDDAYILDPTGKVVCENCERILDCEKYFIKYVREKGHRIWRQNLVDWNGKLFFKKNYDRIYIVNGSEKTCPTRFRVYDRKTKQYWLIDEHGKELTAKYKQLAKKSPSILLAEDGTGQKSFINLDGKILNTFSNLKKQIPDIEEREIENQNGVIVLKSDKNKTHFIDKKGRLLFVKKLKRKDGTFQQGDLVWVKGTNKVLRITSSSIEDDKIRIVQFDKETYEEQISIYSLDRLQLIEVEVKDNAVIITGKEEPMKIEVGDNIWFFYDKKTYTVKSISDKSIAYETRTPDFKRTFIGSGMNSKRINIDDTPTKIERVQKMNYQSRLEKHPKEARVTWHNNNSTEVGFIYQIPRISDSLVMIQYQNNGEKKYLPIDSKKIKIAPLAELTQQDSLRLLSETWRLKNQLFDIDSRDVGNIVLSEGHTFGLTKNKKINTSISFSHPFNLHAGSYFNLPKSDVNMSGDWLLENGGIIMKIEGKGSITYNRDDSSKNFWKHELHFKITKINKDEIELLLEQKKSERLEKKD